MAYAKELVGVGVPPATASGMGGQYNAATAAGLSISDATVLKSSMSIVGSADNSKGVQLNGDVGDEVWVFNNSGSTLKVYPETSSVGITVVGTGLGTAGAAHDCVTYKTVVYKKVTSTQWFAMVSA